MLGYMIWYNIFKILEILDMILYPNLTKICISYLYLFRSFMCSCLTQSQRGFWCFYAILLVIYAVLYTLWCMNQSIHQFLGNIIMLHAAKFQNCLVTLFLPYTESTAKALFIQFTAFARYFEDMLSLKKRWI